ncbi:hypothetical protein NPIL_616471 [Nephila pilipes]|uniref:Uncharacterized protein n=1 Tax=Nephila pilipes TaxID=299642 RepID=A0A8X6UMK5_NEPPI|nr:hypothetical protein NPIL_616471 [Nephila pilipes]
MLLNVKQLLKFVKNRIASKRFILSVMGDMFDPTNFLRLFVIKLKCILQELWSHDPDRGKRIQSILDHMWYSVSCSKLSAMMPASERQFTRSGDDRRGFLTNCFKLVNNCQKRSILYSAASYPHRNTQ